MPKMTVELSDRLDGLVTDLADEQQVPKSLVVRRALALLSYVEVERSKGNRIVVASDDGPEKEIVPL